MEKVWKVLTKSIKKLQIYRKNLRIFKVEKSEKNMKKKLEKKLKKRQKLKKLDKVTQGKTTAAQCYVAS